MRATDRPRSAAGSPRRSIPVELLEDPRAARLSLAQRHTLALLPLALDDHGRALDDPGRINGLLWGPLWREHGPEQLDADLDVLADAGFVVRYEVDGTSYLAMRDWDRHQVVSRRAPSRFPAPPRGAGGGQDLPWAAVEGLAGMMGSAGERLADPAVQARGVQWLAELAGQVDPRLGETVRDRARTWLGGAAAGYGAGAGAGERGDEVITVETGSPGEGGLDADEGEADERDARRPGTRRTDAAGSDSDRTDPARPDHGERGDDDQVGSVDPERPSPGRREQHGTPDQSGTDPAHPRVSDSWRDVTDDPTPY